MSDSGIKSIDWLIAKNIFGWREIQAPQYDFDGPLPNQGLVLVPPDFDEDSFRGWPNRGIIPYDYFVGEKFTGDFKEAFKLVEAMKRKGFKFQMTTEKNKIGDLSYVVEFFGEHHSKRASSYDPKRAICLASLGALSLLSKRAA